jgi:hypothetical protein
MGLLSSLLVGWRARCTKPNQRGWDVARPCVGGLSCWLGGALAARNRTREDGISHAHACGCLPHWIGARKRAARCVSGGCACCAQAPLLSLAPRRRGRLVLFRKAVIGAVPTGTRRGRSLNPCGSRVSDHAIRREGAAGRIASGNRCGAPRPCAPRAETRGCAPPSTTNDDDAENPGWRRAETAAVSRPRSASVPARGAALWTRTAAVCAVCPPTRACARPAIATRFPAGSVRGHRPGQRAHAGNNDTH